MKTKRARDLLKDQPISQSLNPNCINGELVVNLLNGKEYKFIIKEHADCFHLPKRLIKL